MQILGFAFSLEGVLSPSARWASHLSVDCDPLSNNPRSFVHSFAVWRHSGFNPLSHLSLISSKKPERCLAQNLSAFPADCEKNSLERCLIPTEDDSQNIMGVRQLDPDDIAQQNKVMENMTSFLEELFNVAIKVHRKISRQTEQKPEVSLDRFGGLFAPLTLAERERNVWSRWPPHVSTPPPLMLQFTKFLKCLLTFAGFEDGPVSKSNDSDNTNAGRLYQTGISSARVCLEANHWRDSHQIHQIPTDSSHHRYDNSSDAWDKHYARACTQNPAPQLKAVLNIIRRA